MNTLTQESSVETSNSQAQNVATTSPETSNSQAQNVASTSPEMLAYPATVLHKKGGSISPSVEDIKLARQFLQPVGSEILNEVPTEDIINAQISYKPFNDVREFLLG